MTRKKNTVKIKLNRLKVVLAEKEMSHKDLAKKSKKNTKHNYSDLQ